MTNEREYIVDSVDGFSARFTAAKDAVVAEAERVVRERFPGNADRRYEVWDVATDTCVAGGTA